MSTPFTMQPSLPGNIIASCCFVVLLLAVIASAWTYPIQSYDPYWLLSMGRELLAGGDPRVDSFSFTHHGDPVKGSYFIFGGLFYWLTTQLGLDAAATVLRAAAIALTLAAALFTASNFKQSFITNITGLCLILAGLHYRLFLRPELFDYALIGAAFLIYKNSLASITPKIYMASIVLMIAWSNFHGAILGYIVFFALYFQKFIESLTSRELRQYILKTAPLGIALALVGFLNRDLSHPLLEAINFSQEWSQLILEHQQFSAKFDLSSQAYVLWPTSFLIALLCIRQRQFGLLFIIIIVAYSSWTRIRMLSFLAECLGFSLLIAQPLAYSATTSAPTKKIIHALTYLFLLFASMVSAKFVAERSLGLANAASSVPKDITDYMKNTSRGGNILNVMHWGGWLSYALPPNFLYAIDGRTNILFPIEELRDNATITSGDADTLLEYIEAYPIDYMLFDNSKFLFTATILNTQFRPEIITETGTLYSLNEDPLSTYTLLTHYPMCWSSDLTQALTKEHSTATARYTSGAIIPKVIELLSEPSRLTDLSVDQHRQLSTSQRRALGYAALLSEQPSIASELFDSQPKESTLDILIHGYAAYQAGEFQAAKSASLALLSGYWREVVDTTQQPLTDEQRVIAVWLARHSMQAQPDPNVDQLLTAAIESVVSDNAAMDTTGITLIFREHCNSLISAIDPSRGATNSYKNIADTPNDN